MKCERVKLPGGSAIFCSSGRAAATAMRWPASSADLKRAGYVDGEKSKFCACGETIFWFLTPAGRWMPMQVNSDGCWTPHWMNCHTVKAGEKLERKKQAARQGNLFP